MTIYGIISMKTRNTTVPISKLSESHIADMWGLFQSYYSNVNYNQFITDLNDKSFVFLIIDILTDEIVGFSTAKVFSLAQFKAKFIFSGDTIVDKRYWGNNNLGSEFSKYLLKQKLKSPFTKIYWNLISKGYKTYLLLANNFVNYYPHPFKNTPAEIKNIIDSCGEYLYSSNYNRSTGCIEFPTDSSAEKDCLKAGLCEITEGLLKKNKKIAFFQEKNPNWRSGDELVCIGEFTLDLIFRRIIKNVTRKTKLKVLFSKRA